MTNDEFYDILNEMDKLDDGVVLTDEEKIYIYEHLDGYTPQQLAYIIMDMRNPATYEDLYR